MIAAVILCGGQSSRMGSDKSQLKINSHTLLEHMHNLLLKCDIQTIGISGRNHIKDYYENKGPLAGILASLEHYEDYQAVLFVPIDMPLLKTKILLNLISEMPQSITHYTEYNLPLVIRNSKEMREVIESQILDNKLSVYQLLKLVNAKEIKNTFLNQCFMNTNTPEQWQQFILSLPE